MSSIDVSGAASALWRPMGVAAGSQGRLYVTDARARVVELVPDGGRRVLAGAHPGFANGRGTAASMREPSGIAVAEGGRVVVADTLNGLIRVLDMPERLGPWTPTPPSLATGFDLAHFARVPLVWPIDPQEGPHEVAGTLGEPRGNPGGDGRERFHAGVDVRADQGGPSGRFATALSPRCWPTGSIGTLKVPDVGPLTYVHIRAGRDRAEAPVADWATVLADPDTGKPARVRVRRGTHVAAGDMIGSVNRFRHVHLNVGPPGEEANALLVGLPGMVDTVPPVIAPAGITLTDLDGTSAHRARQEPSGRQRARPHRGRGVRRMDDSPPRRRSASTVSATRSCRPMARRRWSSCSRTSRSRSTGCLLPPMPRLAVHARQRNPVLRNANDALSLPGDQPRGPGHRGRVAMGAQSAAGRLRLRVLAEDAAGNVAISGRDLPITVEPLPAPAGYVGYRAGVG